MTKEDLIFELKKRCSFWLNNKTISKKHALECLLGILEKEEFQSSLPSDIEEAADAHIRRVANADREWTTQDIAEAFKAGAGCVAGQGVVLSLSIDELSCEAYSACVEQGMTSEDDVIVQIRKKQ